MASFLRKIFKPKSFVCPQHGCSKACRSAGGLKRHMAQHSHNASTSTSTQSNGDEPQNVPQRRIHVPVPSRLRVNPIQPLESHHLHEDPPPSSPITAHTRSMSPPEFGNEPPSPKNLRVDQHPIIDGTPCNINRNDLPAGFPPPIHNNRSPNDYVPFCNRGEFEFVDFLYRNIQMSTGKVDRPADIVAAMYQDNPAFANHEDLYATIDTIQQGEIPWSAIAVTYDGPLPTSGVVPPWMTTEFEVWFRNPLELLEQQLGNPDFAGETDYAPKRVFDKGNKRQYTDLMSGNWAWKQADLIAEDPDCHGAMFMPIIAGSDKTTVSVATGNNEFYPLYAGIGNIHNSVRRAHRDGIDVLAFLAILKTSREYQDDPLFRTFRRQLFHTSLRHIFSHVRKHMIKPRVTHCGDGHFRRVIYGLGPYIADYPEQALLACIVQGWCPRCRAPADDLDTPAGRRSEEHTKLLQASFTLQELWDNYGVVSELKPFTDGFPRADIHELISSDLLHQTIKGTFKDHLVD
ncbi:hypothetical protein HGRIS_001606 [Hohenbuehelia grisea]|uniref:C2H2-type domain-containing protein n=1 Tax=Hohenbuehelia grisea TaxID=104357 RepID=A0ABR3JIL1_9AGAR